MLDFDPDGNPIPFLTARNGEILYTPKVLDAGWNFRKVLAVFGCGGMTIIILTLWITGCLVQSGY